MENITTIGNTTTEQKSLKNITTIENITVMKKTTIAKITAKIATTALLLFWALFTLTTCLTAQEAEETEQQKEQQTGQQARKQGWFVGVSPFSFVGTEIKISRTTTTEVDVAVGSASFEYEATIDSDDSVSGFVNVSDTFFNSAVTHAEAKQSLIRGAIELCKRSDADATTGRILDANIPLDPTNTAVNTGYSTGDTIDYSQTGLPKLPVRILLTLMLMGPQEEPRMRADRRFS